MVKKYLYEIKFYYKDQHRATYHADTIRGLYRHIRREYPICEGGFVTDYEWNGRYEVNGIRSRVERERVWGRGYKYWLYGLNHYSGWKVINTEMQYD